MYRFPCLKTIKSLRRCGEGWSWWVLPFLGISLRLQLGRDLHGRDTGMDRAAEQPLTCTTPTPSDWSGSPP